MTLDSAVANFINNGLTSEKELIERNVIEGTIENKCQREGLVECTFFGDLEKGVELIHNQYTYRYKQYLNFDGTVDERIIWDDMEEDGWHVRVTDAESTAEINTPICSYINGKPIVSTSLMSAPEKIISATSIDVSSWDTSNVIDMGAMFKNSAATTLDLSSFDTSNVTDMRAMFLGVSTTIGYARTQADADRFNTSRDKPDTLTFVVKPSS